MNNSYCQTRHLYTNKPLFINDNEVNELIKQKEAIKFLADNSNSIYTVPKEVILSRQDLIASFKQINSKLRQLGFQAGYERLSEFANLLFLKLYSENTNEEIWLDIKNAGNTAIVGTVNNSLKLIEKQYNIDGTIFKDTSISDPLALKDIILKLDKLHFSTIDTDIKGEAFEYFIQKSPSADKDLGEYFTPRHIIKIVVNLIKPKFKETIYDPFCGSGGFLTETFSYVKENTIINNLDDKKILSENSFFGGEISNTARLAKMNMILHGDGHSGIKQIDSINNPVQNKYDIVITNIPFGLKELGEFSHLYNNGLAKNNGEAICLLHCFNAVKKGGRMAIIVPEGILFNKSQAMVREFLLNNAKLQTVISLPPGVFLPYTNVKTSILYFTECHKCKTDKIWFFNVNNDGFSLNTARKPIKQNDLRKVDFVKFNLKDQEIEDLGFYKVNIEKITTNSYNLLGNHYKHQIKIKSEYKLVCLGDICEFLPKSKNPASLGQTEGKFKFFTSSEVIKYRDVFDIEEECLIIGDGGKSSIHISNQFSVSDHNFVLRAKDNNIVLNRYIYYFLKHNFHLVQNGLKGSALQNISKEYIQKIKIIVPPIEKQKEIVKQLEKIDNSIKHAKYLIKSIKDMMRDGLTFYDHQEYIMSKIIDVSQINPSKTEIKEKKDIEVSFLPMEDIKEYEKNIFPSKSDTIQNLNKGYTYFKENDLLIAKITPCFENGKMSIVKNLKNGIGFGSTEYIVIRPNNKITNSDWIYYCLLNKNFIKHGKEKMTGTSGHQRISKEFVANYKIPIPTLNIQDEILQKCEEEIQYIRLTEKMIEKQKEKLSCILNSIWSNKGTSNDHK